MAIAPSGSLTSFYVTRGQGAKHAGYYGGLLCGPLRILRGLCGKTLSNRKGREARRKVARRSSLELQSLPLHISSAKALAR
jgi:hypothetical protein